MKLYLLRHGEIKRRGIFYGQLDLGLSRRGLEQAEAVAKALRHTPLSAVYSSDLERASRGGELIATLHNLELRTNAALREMSLGALEGLSYAEAARAHPELESKRYAEMVDYAFPDGETIRQVAVRAEGALRELIAHHADQSVALVAHNSVNRILIGRALGLPLETIFDFDQDFGCINRIDYPPQDDGEIRAKVRWINWTPHRLPE